MVKQCYNKDDIVIYNGDNIDVLRTIADSSVNLIYSDILYNTGKIFDDYNDDLGTPDEAVKWYEPRFREMKRVLASNGSIFIHCNWRLDSDIRKLMDAVFGRACFRNRIYRQHSGIRGFCYNFDSQVDIILYYVKNPENFVFNEVHTEKPQIYPLFENGYVDGRSETRQVNGVELNMADNNKHWLVSPKQFDEIVKAGELKVVNGMPYRFTTVKPIGNLWNEPEMWDTYTRTAVAEAYDTPKPAAILQRIINMCSNPGDMVADFFLGGGTTAVVTKQLGRKGIFCDISEKACNITISKLDK